MNDIHKRHKGRVIHQEPSTAHLERSLMAASGVARYTGTQGRVAWKTEGSVSSHPIYPYRSHQPAYIRHHTCPALRSKKQVQGGTDQTSCIDRVCEGVSTRQGRIERAACPLERSPCIYCIPYKPTQKNFPNFHVTMHHVLRTSNLLYETAPRLIQRALSCM